MAHADEIKAELLANDRRRQLREAQLALVNARLDFAVLVFPNLRDDFELTDDLHRDVPLPLFPEFQAAGGAEQSGRARGAGGGAEFRMPRCIGERAGYLPSLSVDYFYGIDATHFATKTDGVNNLGSSALWRRVSIPIWNWGATQSRVRQAELRRTQAKSELSLAQRKLLAEIQSLLCGSRGGVERTGGLQRSVELGRGESEIDDLALPEFRGNDSGSE